MSETLTRADVERIATLARLELTSEEVALFAAQLTAILAYADQVQQVDTSGVSTDSPSTGVDRLLSIGRNGEFAHILMEDVYWRTVRRARSLAAELKAAVSGAA